MLSGRCFKIKLPQPRKAEIFFLNILYTSLIFVSMCMVMKYPPLLLGIYFGILKFLVGKSCEDVLDCEYPPTPQKKGGGGYLLVFCCGLLGDALLQHELLYCWILAIMGRRIPKGRLLESYKIWSF